MSESKNYNREIYSIIGKCLLEAVLKSSPLSGDFRLGELDNTKTVGKEEVGYVELSFEIPVEINCSEDAELSYEDINDSIIKKWIVVNAQDINKRLTAAISRFLNTKDMTEEYNWDMSPIAKASTGRSQDSFNVEIDNTQKKVRFIISISQIKGSIISK